LQLVANIDEETYIDFVASHPYGHVMQTPQWGRLKSDWTYQTVTLLDDSGESRAASLILERQMPATGKSIFYLPRGPVIDFADQQLVQAFFTELKLFSRRRAFAIKMDPALPVNETGFEPASLGMKPVTNAGFGGFQPKFVFYLPLKGRSLEEIFNGFHSKWRYNIRLASRKGVEIQTGTSKDLPEFYQLLKVTSRRDGFAVRSQEYFERMFELLRPRGWMELYLARYQGKLIAATLMTTFGRKAVYLYGASDNEHRNLMPNHLIQWTMIEDAHRRGFEIYDFRGIPGTSDPDHPLHGLWRFKSGFNPVFTEFIGEYDLVLSPAVYWLWNEGLPRYRALLKKVSR